VEYIVVELIKNIIKQSRKENGDGWEHELVLISHIKG